MEEVRNFNEESVKELIKDFPLEPMFTRVIITLNRSLPEDGEVVLTDTGLDEVQYVVSCGPTAQVKPGMKILLDLEKLTVQVPNERNTHEMDKIIKVDPIFVDGTMFAVIYDNQIKCKFIK